MNNFGLIINGKAIDSYPCLYLYSITEVDFSTKSREISRWDTIAFINDIFLENSDKCIHFIKMDGVKDEYVIENTEVAFYDDSDKLFMHSKNPKFILSEPDFKFKIYTYISCEYHKGYMGYGVSIRDDNGKLIYIKSSGGEISFAKDVAVGNVGGGRLYLYGLVTYFNKRYGNYVSKSNGELAILHSHDPSDRQGGGADIVDYADARSYIKPISIKMPSPQEEELVRKRGKYFYVNADSKNINVVHNPYIKV